MDWPKLFQSFSNLLIKCAYTNKKKSWKTLGFWAHDMGWEIKPIQFQSTASLNK